MNSKILGTAGLLLISAPLFATEPYVVIDYAKVDARQYCVFEGKIYTRGIRIKTDTGTYTCRLTESKPGENPASRELLSWVREGL